MEGTEPLVSSSAAPRRESRSPAKRVVMVLGVVALLIVAGYSLYTLTHSPPVPLTLVDGSTTQVLAKDFQNYPWTNTSLIWYVNATTDALQAGGPVSSLTLRLWVAAFALDGSGNVELGIRATVDGRLATNLNARDVTVTLNQTGRYAWSAGYEQPAPSNVSYAAPGRIYVEFPGPQNVTYDATPIYQTSGPGSSSITRGLQNQTGPEPIASFVLPAQLTFQDSLSDTGLFGVTATVTGGLAPAIGVSILLQIVNTPSV